MCLSGKNFFEENIDKNLLMYTSLCALTYLHLNMTDAINKTKRSEEEDLEWLNVVRKKVSQLRYGSVQITVHDGRVTQVESIEKTRFVQRSKEE
jgi:hypothetical protein